jgi:N-acetylmuramoyl-L-alanine amidase
MKTVRSRTFMAAFTAFAIMLVFAAEAVPSYDTEAGRKYDIARERVAELKKSKKRKRYRSYWMDCIRTFELVEKKYPRSSSAGDACIDRAGLYLDMYLVSRHSRDKTEAIKVYSSCQKNHPKHVRAPEALFHMIEVYLDHNKDTVSANRVLSTLIEEYPDSSWTARAKTRLSPAAKNQKKAPELRKPPSAEIRSASLKPMDPSSIGTVKGIRQWSSESYTRIVVDLDKPLRKFESHELKEPDRLVFDLQGARMDDTLSKDPLVLNNGILRQVRSSQYSPDTVRVVLDLASIKSYAAFPLHDPERLVIDVNGEATGPGPDQAASTATAETPAPATPGASAQQPSPGSHGTDKLSLSRQLGLKIKTIAIDAGHGGHDPGAIGRGGLKEKTITLDVARRLAALVRENLDCGVILTRDKDEFIPLEDRPAIARTKGADLFVSIHVNASRKRKARGIETYIQGLNASDRDAMATAARENATTTKKLSELDSELEKILKGLSMQSDDDDSVQLAHAVQNSLVDTMKPLQGHVVNLGVKRAFFYVLINTDMPSILAEVGFISNPDEEKLLRKESYRQAVAEALFEGIKRYVDVRNRQVMGI